MKYEQHYILLPTAPTRCFQWLLLEFLSMQLGFAVWPLMRFTGEKAKMGEFVNPLWIKILGWTTATIIIILNVKLLFDTFMPATLLNAFYGHLGLPVPTP